MGQAKARGSFEQRKAEACAAELEQARLDQWLMLRRPIKSHRRKAMVLMAMLLASGVYQPYSRDRR